MKFLPVASMVALSVSNVSAQQFEPAPYELTDGFAITPQVSATVRYDDNIYSAESDTTSSSIFLLTPSIKFGTDDGINQYGGSYELTSGSYSESSDDNFVDHKLKLLAHTEFSAKQRTDFIFSFSNLHEDRGTGLTETGALDFDEVLKYNELTAQGYYQYGGLSSIMRVGGGIAYADKAYQNFTEQTDQSDVSGLRFYTDADYQVGSVTFLTFDLSTTAIEYDNDTTRDNQDTRALIGLKWQGLGKTTGTVKAGYQHKDFDNSVREDFSGNTVDLGVVWEPVQYSALSAHLTHAAEDSNTVGDYIETLGGSIVWDHNWNDKLDSSLQYIYLNENYIGETREDDTNSVALYLNYDFTRWMKVTAGYEFTSKDSNATNISYDKNAVNLGVVVAL